AEFGKNSTIVCKTKNFGMICKRRRQGGYVPFSNPVYVCMTSDFFVNEADTWRLELWSMIKQRSDLFFCIVTKRIERFFESLPTDWGSGYSNVRITVTCENQEYADRRIPILLELPLHHRSIIHEPMLESIWIAPYLKSGKIESVVCGGESGPESRICEYDWILKTRDQCRKYGVSFFFKQTGRLFKKDGRVYTIPRFCQESQARLANINLP
ncbi:MAG: DUF5131 family protein, partial [Desulfovibrio sp.]|nr:DUF5131 family protein [Desulfovibrio sp.]